MQPSNKRGIPELDAVRGIAASVVALWHYPILWAGFYLAGTFVGTKSVTLWVLVGIAGLAVTVLASVLTYRFIEVPALSLARKPLNRFEASAAPP